MADDFAWGPLIARLEQEFAARDMRDHLQLLGKFRELYESGTRRRHGMARPPWTTETLVELAACFQLPPFSAYYPVATRTDRCLYCDADLSAREVATVRAVLPDRKLHSCRQCRGRWLVLSPSAER